MDTIFMDSENKKTSDPHNYYDEMKNLNYLMDHILYQIFNIVLNTSLKNIRQLLIILQ